MQTRADAGQTRAGAVQTRALPEVRALCRRGADEKPEAERLHAERHAALKNLRARRAGDGRCADCAARTPGWAALPHGVFVCIECAQVHRSLGRHISQVKAFSTGTYLWYADEVECMRQMGNAAANALYLARLAPEERPDASTHSRREIAEFIRDKYVHRRWIQVGGEDHQASQASPEIDASTSCASTKCASTKSAPLEKTKNPESPNKEQYHQVETAPASKRPEDAHAERCKRILAAYDSDKFFGAFGL